MRKADTMVACPECGAVTLDGITCREKFQEMLALEFESPSVFGAVHHVTVICYNLQHPGAFSEEALAWMHASLRSVVERGLSPAELRRRAGKKFGSKIKIRQVAPAGSTSTVSWSMSVLEVRTNDPGTYIKDVMAWAKSILKDINIEEKY